jgi:integrase
MPKRARELTALDVRRATHPGGDRPATIAAGGVSGLLLQLTPAGAKSWLLRVQVGERRREIGLGAYPEIGVAEARQRAREAREAIREGRDPVEERKAARAALAAAQRRGLTFAEATERFLAGKASGLANAKHAAQWRSTLATYAEPELGKMLVAEITVQDVLRVVQPIWNTKAETASRVRGRVEAVLAWATVNGHRTGDNPARWGGNIAAILPPRGAVAKVANHGALSLRDAPSWWAALATRDGIAARALAFAALTAARSGEVRGATWAELDLDAGLWTIPGARMKAGRDHRVPLCAEAVALLRALPRLDGSELVFPAARGAALSDMSLSAVMRRMHEAEIEAERPGWLDARSGRPAVPHGLRSTFRDWAAERGVERDLAEVALAHVVGSDVERAYRRSDMLERRRAVMAAWAAFLAGGEAGAEVVPLRAAR